MKSRERARFGGAEALHAEIFALKTNDVTGLERATATKLAAIEAVADFGIAPAGPDLRALAEEAHRLNETSRIHVNLMAANVRRRLQSLTGVAGAGASGGGYRAGAGLAAYMPERRCENSR